MRALLFASIAIAVAAASAPGLVQAYLDRSGGPEPRVHAAESAEERAEPGASGHVEIEAAADGHFYVEAFVNLRPVRMMVDTGATVIALRQSDAEAAGIRLGPADFDQPVQTANGTVAAAEAELDSVEVEGILVGGVRALVIPDEQLKVSLLGGSFLHRLARFEVSGGRLIFEN